MSATEELYARLWVTKRPKTISVMATTTQSQAILYPSQDLCFYAVGRHWGFYYTQLGAPSYEVRFGFRSSPDGINWTGQTNLGEIDGSGCMGAHYDGEYMHYVRIRTQTVIYRRGKPNPDGTVTWSAAEQSVIFTPGSPALHPYIAILPGGYPVIVYSRDVVKYTPRAIISDNNDGTWSGSEVEFELNATDDIWAPSVHAMGSGLYSIYGRDEDTLKGREYTTSWQPEEDSGYDTEVGLTWSAVEKNGEIHVSYVDDTDLNIYHGYRDAGGTWQSRTLVQTDNVAERGTKIMRGRGALYIFWIDASLDVVYYRKSTDNGATWLDESGNDAPQKFVDCPLNVSSNRDIQAYRLERSGQIGVMWRAGASPYSIYFATMGAIDESVDLKAEFFVKKWPFADSLTINVGSIAAGSLTDTYENNGVLLQLNEVFPGTPAFDYDFVFETIPASVKGLVIRLNGYYQGNPAHNVKARIYNYTTPGWEDLTAATTDFPTRSTEDDYAFAVPNMSDYVSGGQLQLKIIHTSLGSAGHYFWVDYLKLDDSTVFSDLESQMIVRQKADVNLKAIIGVAHWEDFKAVFTVRQERFVRRRLYAKFVVKQTLAAADLLCEFKVSRDTLMQNIFAEFFVDQYNALYDLSAVFYVRPDHLLIKEFEIEKRSRKSRNWLR